MNRNDVVKFYCERYSLSIIEDLHDVSLCKLKDGEKEVGFFNIADTVVYFTSTKKVYRKSELIHFIIENDKAH